MREMKDTSVFWCPTIPTDWSTIKNKYILSLLYSGGTPSAGDEKFYTLDNGVPFVSISDMSSVAYVKSTKKQVTDLGIADKKLKILPKGTILYSIYATIGAVSELEIDATISQAMLALQVNDSIYKPFYKYNLLAMREYVLSDTNGNTQFNLNAEKVRNFVFILPPMKDQQKIAAHLDRKCTQIDTLISNAQQQIEKLKAYKQSVITETVTKGLDPDVTMKDSGVEWIGEIPENSSLVPMKYLAEAIGDGIHSTPNYDINGDIFFINGNNIGEERLHFKESTNKLNAKEFANYKAPLLTDNTILITLNGATYGKTSFYNNEPVLLGKSAGYITLKPYVNKRYIRYYLQSSISKLIMDLSLAGTTIQNVSLRTLNTFTVVYTQINEQERIVTCLDHKCSQIDNLIALKQQKIEKLQQYKKSLIYEYVTGKKEV